MKLQIDISKWRMMPVKGGTGTLGWGAQSNLLGGMKAEYIVAAIQQQQWWFHAMPQQTHLHPEWWEFFVIVVSAFAWFLLSIYLLVPPWAWNSRAFIFHRRYYSNDAYLSFKRRREGFFGIPPHYPHQKGALNVLYICIGTGISVATSKKSSTWGTYISPRPYFLFQQS